MSYSISICIPVYNCGAYLGQALDSILPQVGDDVEVVIYDGGSTDNTSQVVESYLEAFPRLHYHRASARGGIDADMATCVAHARGEYCWLFSGDDVMRKGALRRALDSVRTRRDVYICQHSCCTIDMEYRRDYPVMAPNHAFTANLSESRERREWFSRASNTEAFFSFMSGLVIRRAKWQDGRLIPEFDRSCWAHVARLFELIETGLSVSYIPEVWLDQRGGNDSFRERGIVDRVRLAIEGFNRIGDHFFSRQSVEAFHIRRVLRNEFSFKAFLIFKLMATEGASAADRKLLDRMVKEAYSDRSLQNVIKEAGYHLTPRWIIPPAVTLWQLLHGRPRDSWRR